MDKKALAEAFSGYDAWSRKKKTPSSTSAYSSAEITALYKAYDQFRTDGTIPQFENGRVKVNPLDISGLDQNVINRLKSDYQSTWGTAYNLLDPIDTARRTNKAMPVSYASKYSDSNEDLWLYSQGLPSYADFTKAYNSTLETIGKETKKNNYLGDVMQAWTRGGAYENNADEDTLKALRKTVTDNHGDDYGLSLEDLQKAYTAEKQRIGAARKSGENQRIALTNQNRYDEYQAALAEQEAEKQRLLSYDVPAAEAERKTKKGEYSLLDYIRTLINVPGHVQTPQNITNARAERDAITQLDSEISTARQVQTLAKYEAETKNPEFAKYNYAPASYKFSANRDAQIYKYVNNINGTQKAFSDAAMNGQTNSFEHFNTITEDERKLYNYILFTKGAKAGTEYMNALEKELSARYAQDLSGQVERFAKGAPVVSDIASVAGTFLQPEGMLYSIGQTLQGKEIDPNNPRFGASMVKSGIRGTRTEQIQSDVLDILYNTGMSFADSLAAGFATGGGTGAGILLGVNAAGDATRDAVQRGADSGQAVLAGGFAGLAEAVFEKIGIDELFKIPSKAAKGALILTTLRQAGVEGTEEALTEISNTITDALIMGGKSSYETAVRNYVAQGMTEQEARQKAGTDIAANIGISFISGALMGGISGGGAYGVGRMNPQTEQGIALTDDGAVSQQETAEVSPLETNTAIDAQTALQDGAQAAEIANAIKNMGLSENASQTVLQALAASNQQSAVKLTNTIKTAAATLAEVDADLNVTTTELRAELQVAHDALKAAKEAGDVAAFTSAASVYKQKVQINVAKKEAAELKAANKAESVRNSVIEAAEGLKTEQQAAIIKAQGGNVNGEGALRSQLYDNTVRQAARTGGTENAGAPEAIVRGTVSGTGSTAGGNLAETARQNQAVERGRSATNGLARADSGKGTGSSNTKAPSAGRVTWGKSSTPQAEQSIQRHIETAQSETGNAVNAKVVAEADVDIADKLQIIKNIAGINAPDVFLYESDDTYGNGWTDETGIYVRTNGNAHPAFTYGHELGHRDADMVKAGMSVIDNMTKTELDAYKAYRDAHISTPDNADTKSELIADMYGRYLCGSCGVEAEETFGLSPDTIRSFEQAFEDAYGTQQGTGETEGEVIDTVSQYVAKGDPEYSRVTDRNTLTFLNNQKPVKVYRAMQQIDGKLYPPMAAKVKSSSGGKELVAHSEIGAWEQADERPDLIRNGNKFELDKANGSSITAAYNPYFHTSKSPLNDQFSSAYKRDNLVVVEGEVPSSELTSGYRAQYAKDSVGEMKWHSGPVSSKLRGDKARSVILSRWFKPIRIVPDTEVASKVANVLDGENIEIPYNVVTPSLAAELRKKGVRVNVGNAESEAINTITQYIAKGDPEYSRVMPDAKDSDGNTLTPEQAEFFRDSKVRDESGKLLVVYHGVKNPVMEIADKEVRFSPSFSEFDVSKQIEPGAWFTPDKEYAKGYGQPVPFYLNIKNPLKHNNPLEAPPEGYDGIYRTYEPMVLRGKKQSVSDAYEFAVFSPEQIKSVTNQTPTSSPDIRYSRVNFADEYGNELSYTTPTIHERTERAIAKGGERFYADTTINGEKKRLTSNDKAELEKKLNDLKKEQRMNTLSLSVQNLRAAAGLYSEGETVESYFNGAGDKADFGVARLLRAIYLRNGVNQGGAMSDKEMLKVLENSDQWKDKSAFSYGRETLTRNLEDIAPTKEECRKLVDTYVTPVRQSVADMVRWMRPWAKRIGSLKLNREESTMVQIIGENLIDEDVLRKGLTYENGKPMDVAKIMKAIPIFREFYNESLEKSNAALMRNGYRPINARKDYFPHMYEEFGDWRNFIEKVVKGGEQTLPTAISGMTDIFTPGKPWFRNFLERTGEKTDYDAVRGFSNYLAGAGRVIFLTDSIQRIRQLEASIRIKYANYNPDSKLTADEQKKHLTNFAAQLLEYGNQLAGKKAKIDRSLEESIGRKIFAWTGWLKKRFGANAVGMSISSALTNFIPLTQALSLLNKKDFARGMQSAISRQVRNDGLWLASDFLTSRFGTPDALVTKDWDKFKQDARNATKWLFETIDQFTAETIVFAKYAEGINKGLSEEKAMKAADEFAERVMAGRSIGSVPTLLNTKTLGFVAQFQLEVNNQLSFMMKDIPRSGDRKKIVKAFVQLFIYAFLYNELMEKHISGRRPAFDPIGTIAQAVEDFSTKKFGDAAFETGANIIEQLPFGNLFTGGGRIPLADAIEGANPLEAIRQTLNGEDASGAWESWGTAFLSYFVAPVGGGQARKTIQGVSAYAKEGRYIGDRLAYPVDQSGVNFFKTLLNGPTAVTPQGYNWETDTLTKAQTETYEEMVSEGIDKWDAYNYLRTMDGGSNAGKLTSMVGLDADEDGKPDLAPNEMNIMAAVLGIKVPKGKTVPQHARALADEYIEDKRKDKTLSPEKKAKAEDYYETMKKILGR